MRYLSIDLQTGEGEVVALPAGVLPVLLYAQVAVGRVGAQTPRGGAARLLQRLLVVVRQQRAPRYTVRRHLHKVLFIISASRRLIIE